MSGLLSSVGGIDSSLFQRPQSMKDMRSNQAPPVQKDPAPFASKPQQPAPSTQPTASSSYGFAYKGSQPSTANQVSPRPGPASQSSSRAGFSSQSKEATNSQLDALLGGSVIAKKGRYTILRGTSLASTRLATCWPDGAYVWASMRTGSVRICRPMREASKTGGLKVQRSQSGQPPQPLQRYEAASPPRAPTGEPSDLHQGLVYFQSASSVDHAGLDCNAQDLACVPAVTSPPQAAAVHDDLDNVFGLGNSFSSQQGKPQAAGPDDPFALFGGLGTTEQHKPVSQPPSAEDDILGGLSSSLGTPSKTLLCSEASDISAGSCLASIVKDISKSNAETMMRKTLRDLQAAHLPTSSNSNAALSGKPTRKMMACLPDPVPRAACKVAGHSTPLLAAATGVAWWGPNPLAVFPRSQAQLLLRCAYPTQHMCHDAKPVYCPCHRQSWP